MEKSDKTKRTKKDILIDLAKNSVYEQELRVKIEQSQLERRKLMVELEEMS